MHYTCYVVIGRSHDNNLEVIIKVGSYFALSNGEPKHYCQRTTLTLFVVDRHKCVLLNLIDYIWR
jgi:hypothetical protein